MKELMIEDIAGYKEMIRMNYNDFTTILGYMACSAHVPAQHCWMCCANECNIVGPRFDDHETIEMLALVGSEV